MPPDASCARSSTACFAAGPHEAVWDGRNERGEAAAVGVYFYRLDAMGESHTHKLVLAR